MELKINATGTRLGIQRGQAPPRREKRGEEEARDGKPEQDGLRQRPGQQQQQRHDVARVHGALREGERALTLTAHAVRGLRAIEEEMDALGGFLRVRSQALDAIRAHGAPPPPQMEAWEAQAAETLAGHLAKLERLARETRFGQQRLLDGSLGCTGMALGKGLRFVSTGPDTRSSPAQGYEVRLTQEPVRATLLGVLPLDAARLAAGETLSLSTGEEEATLTTRPGEQLADVLTRFRDLAALNGLPLLIDATRDGRMVVRHQYHGAAFTFTAASSTPGVLSNESGVPMRVANGRDIAGTLHGEPCTGQGQLLTGREHNPFTAGLCIQFTGLSGMESHAGRPLPQGQVSPLDPSRPVGRVIVAQQSLRIHLGPMARETDPLAMVTVRIDSMRPQHLAVAHHPDGSWDSLADIRCQGQGDLLQALGRHAQASREVTMQREKLETDVVPRIRQAIKRHQRYMTVLPTRPNARDRKAMRALEELEGAQDVVRTLTELMRYDVGQALDAQHKPTPGSMLELLEPEEDEMVVLPARRATPQVPDTGRLIHGLMAVARVENGQGNQPYMG